MQDGEKYDWAIDCFVCDPSQGYVVGEGDDSVGHFEISGTVNEQHQV